VFPIDKRLVHVVMYPAPDVVPQVLFAIDDVPAEAWNEADSLEDLATVMAPYLAKHGARVWDFVWSMERHFSEPYGPLPKATQPFMAGIPDMFIGEIPTNEDVLVEAAPYQYDAGDELPDDYRFWLEKLMFAHGECMDPYFGREESVAKTMFDALDEWSIAKSPDAETRLRFSNFANEEYKHQYQFYKVYAEFDPELPFKIYEHEQVVFRAYQAMQMEGTWVDRGINNMLSDRFGVYQGFEWVQSSYAPLARVSLKVVKDERGHSNMGYLNLRGCIERDPDARANANRRINEYWYPYFMASFGSEDSENNRNWRRWGLKLHTNPQLRAAYHAEAAQVFESLGIDVPDLDDALERGMEMAGKAKAAAGA
jgi:1,2-phenylacetyl-CoA epoxidase catalytic subunit